MGKINFFYLSLFILTTFLKGGTEFRQLFSFRPFFSVKIILHHDIVYACYKTKYQIELTKIKNKANFKKSPEKM